MPDLSDLDKRIRALEDQYRELLLKGKVLAWIGGGLLGLLTLLGISLPALLKSAVQRARDSSEKQINQSIDADLGKARQASADLDKKIAQANSIVPIVQVRKPVNVEPPKHIDQSSLPHAAPAILKSRTERQITALSDKLKSEPVGSFTPARLTDDTGQLLNGVEVFIADMQARVLSPDYAGQVPEIYKNLNHLSVDTRILVAKYDDSAHDSGAAWHSGGWFDQFNERLKYMELTHEKEGTMTSADLDKWKADFENVRNGLWGTSVLVPWPQPLVD